MKLYPQLIQQDGTKEYACFKYSESAKTDLWIKFFDTTMGDGSDPESARKVAKSARMQEFFDELLTLPNPHGH